MSCKQLRPHGGNVSRRPNRRWTLRSISVFRHFMQFPGRGQSFSVRALAEESGVSQGLIDKLLTGRQDNADVDDATALAEALGSTILPLFAPPASPNPSQASRRNTPNPASEE
ncbi:helix-turn-helix domain-containing protein [Streptomyces sp. NPDC008150]|uniref:helix-turn-helix domain-containing protein n=1 Tax=Streptomyces sp. NPDC008150 TaxID=3364816 RepID=UPI0036EC7F36